MQELSFSPSWIWISYAWRHLSSCHQKEQHKFSEGGWVSAVQAIFHCDRYHPYPYLYHILTLEGEHSSVLSTVQPRSPGISHYVCLSPARETKLSFRTSVSMTTTVLWAEMPPIQELTDAELLIEVWEKRRRKRVKFTKRVNQKLPKCLHLTVYELNWIAANISKC